MRYLRMLTNSLAGGVLAAAHLTVLLLYLNPSLPIWSGVTGRWFGILLLTYGLHAAVLCYALLVIRQVVSEEVPSPGWISVRLLAWVSAAVSSAAAALMWLNLRAFDLSLGPEASARLEAGALALTVAAAVLFGLAVAYSGFGWRGSRVAAAALLAINGASLGSVVVLRGDPGAEPPRPAAVGPIPGLPELDDPLQVTLLMLDGASLDYITPAVADGRLPNLGRLLDTGASMHLTTVRPTQPGPAWVAVATGKYPFRTGIRSAATYRVRRDGHPIELLPGYCFSHALVRFGFVGERPHTSEAWRARPLWQILGERGISVGIVRWPVTYPAQPVRGYLVTERFHERLDGSFVLDDTDVAYPADWLPMARAAALEAAAGDAGVLPAAAVPGAEAVELRDRSYARVAAALQARAASRFLAIRYKGLDTTGHRFLREAMPRMFGDVSEEERHRYGQMLDRYYAYIDGEIGRAMDAAGPDDLLLVVSAFGMEPLGVAKRLLTRALGDHEFSGTHEEGPDGFMLGYGTMVAPGRLPLGSIVDVAPTVLYFLGLPVGRDMDGYARTDMFEREFTAERPITYIPTYEW
jgi:hypothetical protein